MEGKPSITAISWTGGKDCNLALLFAKRDPALDVRYLVVFRISEKAFHAHPISLMRKQAKSLALKLLFVDFPEGTTDYFQAYVDGIRNLYDTYGVSTISTGDMDLVGTMERNWMERCCEAAGINVHLPLWEINREEALDTMIEEGFEIIYSCVKSPFFDASWINRKLDRIALEDMKKIISSGLTPEQINDGVKPLDLCGERGEYHTMCIGGPLYKSKIRLEVNDEPNMQMTKQTTKWEGNIHNSSCIWTISLKEDGEDD